MPDQRPIAAAASREMLKMRWPLYMHQPDGSGRFRRQAAVSLDRVSEGCPAAPPHGPVSCSPRGQRDAGTYGIKELARRLLDGLGWGRSNTRPSVSGGQVAQLVEQRTENPRVGGSIPPLATILIGHLRWLPNRSE